MYKNPLLPQRLELIESTSFCYFNYDFLTPYYYNLSINAIPIKRLKHTLSYFVFNTCSLLANFSRPYKLLPSTPLHLLHPCAYPSFLHPFSPLPHGFSRKDFSFFQLRLWTNLKLGEASSTKIVIFG